MRRRFHWNEFPIPDLVAAKGAQKVTLCIPARDEAATVGAVVAAFAPLRGVGLVDEVIVVDDHSQDGTAHAARSAGADVVSAGRGHSWGPGKGGAMRDGVAAASGDLVVFCDADVTNASPHFVAGLLGPLLTAPGTVLTKAAYLRSLPGQPGEGGRVTQLVARPALALAFPALAWLAQPLAGECAARRDVLESLSFNHGYGVDLGLVIDVAERFGADTLAEVDLGERAHRNRPLAELSAQAVAVLAAVLERSGGLPPAELADLPQGETVVPVSTGRHEPLRPAAARRSA